jgi:hypothetical protein
MLVKEIAEKMDVTVSKLLYKLIFNDEKILDKLV